MNFPFTSTICYSVTLCLGQAYLTFKGENFTLEGRMVVAVIGTTIECIALLLITVGAHLFGGTSMYLLALLMCLFLGILNAVMQTAIIGLAGTMGQEMSAACMLGLGFSGIMSLILSLLVQAIDKAINLSEEMDGLIVTLVAFGFCCVYTVVSAWVYRILTRVPDAVEAIGRLERRRSSARDLSNTERNVSSNGISLIRDGGGESAGKAAGASPAEGRAAEAGAPVELASPVEEMTTLQRTQAVLREVAPQALNVFLTFATSLSIFPGVVIVWSNNPMPGSLLHDNKQLLGTLLIGSFQVFDVVGRSMAGCCMKCIAPSRLWIFVVLRIVFIPLFVLGQRFPEAFVLWGSDEGRLFLVAALATTNGLCGTLAMMYGPERCPDESREVAGIAMSCTMVTGIFMGFLLAPLNLL